MVIGPEQCGKGALLNSMKTAIENKYVQMALSKVWSYSGSQKTVIKEVPSFSLNLQQTVRVWEGIGWRHGN